MGWLSRPTPFLGRGTRDMDHSRQILRLLAPVLLAVASAGGCHQPIPVMAHFQGTAQVAAQADVRGEVAVKLPAAADPGPMVASVVQASRHANPAPRVAVIDVDGLLVNQNADGTLGAGENPVAVFREKLMAAAADRQVAAVVVRIHSPGGGVTACDIMSDELDRFKVGTRRPVVACLMDVATSGAYYLAAARTASWPSPRRSPGASERSSTTSTCRTPWPSSTWSQTPSRRAH